MKGSDCLYRFRNASALLGDKSKGYRSELEEGIVYFASPENLNDPMETYRHMVWASKNKHLWDNFFNQFVALYTLTKYFEKERIESDFDWKRVLLDEISLRDLSEVYSKYADVLVAVLSYVREQSKMDGLIRVCTKERFKAPIKKSEIELIFMTFGKIVEVLIDRLSINKDGRVGFMIHPVDEQLFVDLRSRLITILVMGQVHKMIGEGMMSTGVDINSGLDCILSRLKFISNYFDCMRLQCTPRQEKPLFACFMDNFSNSSSWGHYADSHKGACLIFSQDTLVRANGEGGLPFEKIEYRDNFIERNYFSSLLANNSVVGPSFVSIMEKCDKEKSRRQDAYREYKEDLVTKHSGWLQEKEHRVSIIGNREEKGRFISIDNSQIKGIIFGIAMDQSIKEKIISLIQDKKNGFREDFEYYQAYFDNDTGGINKVKLFQVENIKLSEIT